MRNTIMSPSNYITIKNQEWYENQKIAGDVASSAISLLVKECINTRNCLELNTLAEEFIFDNHCEPTFKNYKGFPAGVCISINNELVHGVPKDIDLQDGDIVSFDLGATFRGAIADTARTTIVGQHKDPIHHVLLHCAEGALEAGIEAIKVGNRIGVIGEAIYNYVKNFNTTDSTIKFGLINNYGGHGLDLNIPHADPFIANKADKNEGVIIKPGMTFAIEPMCIIGDTHTYISKDNWTVMGNGLSCHIEHTMFVHDNCVEIMTWRKDATDYPTNKFYFD